MKEKEFINPLKIAKKFHREVFRDAYKLFENKMEDVCTEVVNSIIDDLFSEYHDHPKYGDTDFNEYADLALDIYQEILDEFRRKK
jgi:hypothetical protein